MTAYVALLRAVNVGGTGKLPMAELRAMCEALGFERVRTYIASGNAVFDSDADERQVKHGLERALHAYAAKPVGVLVRTGADLMSGVRGQTTEVIARGRREIYVHYVDGLADTKLRIAAASAGTARNINTIAKLADWACG
jgi:uncharacterized protein (DUF1697 family)